MNTRLLLTFAALICPLSVYAQDKVPDLHIVLREQGYHETVLSGSATDLGAIRVGTGTLYDETATNRVGSILMSCTNNEVENGVVINSFCSGVMKLPDGVLTWSAASGIESDKTKVHDLVFTGGSGAYANMRGYGLNKFGTRPSYQEIFLFRQH